MTSPVVVIGAGTAGICVALELARNGRSSILVEREAAAMRGAGRRNEGKLHLGHTFAMDASLATARLMQRGACSFGPLLARWLGTTLPAATRPYGYLVHGETLLSPDELGQRYAAIAALASEQPTRDYLGLDPAEPARRVSPGDLAAQYGPDILAAFNTPEIAVDPRGHCAVDARQAGRRAFDRVPPWERGAGRPPRARVRLASFSVGGRLGGPAGRAVATAGCEWLNAPSSAAQRKPESQLRSSARIVMVTW